MINNDEINFDQLYRRALNLTQQLPFISCAILQRKLYLRYSVAKKILGELKSAGHRVLDEKDLVANPQIKIVFINNAGSESIQAIIAKAHPNIEIIQLSMAEESSDA